MSTGSRAAKKGFQNELDFIRLANEDAEFNKKLSALIGVEVAEAKKTENARSKSDVDLFSAREKVSCLSLKNFEGQRSGFNQVDRRWLADFFNSLRRCSVTVPEGLVGEMQQGLLAKAVDPKNTPLIAESHQQSVCSFFSNNRMTILIEIFTKNEAGLDWLVVSHDVEADSGRGMRDWYCLKLNEVLERLDSLGEVGFSRGGKTLMICPTVITMQRKGGDGNVKKFLKIDPRHPSNQIQFKMNPLKLIELCSAVPFARA